MAQVRSIRPAVWAGVAIAGLLAPLTQKGPRDYACKQITRIEIEKKQAGLDSEARSALRDPNSVTDRNLIEHAGHLLSHDLEFELNEAHYVFARNFSNRNSYLTFEFVKRKDYKINEEDVINTRNDTDSLQAYAATQNESYPIAEEDLQILVDNPKGSKFEDGLRKHPKFEEITKTLGYIQLLPSPIE